MPADHSDITRLNVFGAKLMQELAREGEENIFISPVGIAALCGMALCGADARSDVADEFTSVLGNSAIGLSNILRDVRSDSDDRVQISLANSVWVARSVRKEYQGDVGRIFQSDVLPLPSDAATINQWASKATDGLITDIVQGIDPTDVALLVNAVFFKGEWKESFDLDDTVDYPFWQTGGREVLSRMMMQREVTRKYGTISISSGTIRLLEIPYGSKERYSAVIVLPSNGATVSDALAHISNWNEWVETMCLTKFASVGLPRFRLSFGTKSVKPALQALGLKKFWTPPAPDEPAHFPLLSDDRDLHISDIVHRAVVEVTEEGTMAAAAGAMKIRTRSAETSRELRMIADEPFLFVVRDVESGLVLYMGKVDRPESP